MSDIDWPRIMRDLAAPFDAADLKTKPGRGGGQITYIDARTVAERLDAVVGAQNWHFDWLPMILSEDAVHVVKGTLTIYGVSKSDIGDSEKIEPNKGAVSDALKRAAVLWGIGRYLYGIESPQAARAVAQQNQQAAAKSTLGRAESHGERRAPQEATPSTPPTRQTFATDAQQAQIRDLVGPAGMNMDALLARLEIRRLADLPANQVDDVIARLQRRIDAKRAAATQADPNAPVADTPKLTRVS